MPKSNIRTKKGRNPQMTHADKKRIEDGYYKRLDEYLLMPLDRLINEKATGIYWRALEDAKRQKTEIEKLIEKQNETSGITANPDKNT